MSIFDIYKIGIGPSSSHTTGPMIAANLFLDFLKTKKKIQSLKTIDVELYGSLALTGAGHSTDRAIALGLMGNSPESIDPLKVDELLNKLKMTSTCLFENIEYYFCINKNIKYFKNKELPFHPNGICFIAKNHDNNILEQKNYYSIGGGFVVDDDFKDTKIEAILKFPFKNAKDIKKYCIEHNISISELAYENELHSMNKEEFDKKILKIWKTMNSCIENGLSASGLLPGSLKLKRRASSMHLKLTKLYKKNLKMAALSAVEVYALAVSEENANGGQIVTAPTNGAAGIIPAVIKYYLEFIDGANIEGVKKILLTSGIIGQLYKKNASISGAEVGCQGEVGVAASMAAAGLAEALGCDIHQVENAAEIAMEHSLGLTCDPVGGYVQIPCIERNAMGAVKAIAAAQMALLGDGCHKISLDKVIKTMFQTGIDMQSKYRETSLGGLAVNIPEC